jgi:alkylated DNA repair dioxygenase AlkB
VVALQLRLDSALDPSIDLGFSRARRIELGEGAWIEHVDGWVRGAESLFSILEREMTWRADERRMYDRIVAVPRLRARHPRDGVGHPLLDAMAAALGPRYGARFDAITMALYRNGDDSVAWHRDRDHRDRLTSVVAVASLGGPRRFTVRPLLRASGARSIAFSIESGDLVVMGGSCQRTVEHAVPKVRQAPARIALMFRHTEPISPLVP